MIFLGEVLTAKDFLGCALILSGVLAVELLPLWLNGAARRRTA